MKAPKNKQAKSSVKRNCHTPVSQQPHSQFSLVRPRSSMMRYSLDRTYHDNQQSFNLGLQSNASKSNKASSMLKPRVKSQRKCVYEKQMSKECLKSFKKAKNLIKACDFNSAANLLKLLIQKYPHSPQLIYQLALTYFQAESWDDSYTYFKMLSSHQSRQGRLANFYLSMLFKRQGRLDEALQHINKFLQSQKQDQNAFILKAKILQRLGYHSDALKQYYKLSAANPSNPAVMIGLADCLKAVNNLSQADKYYQQASKIIPKSEVFLKRGINLFQMGLYKEALREFQEQVERDPQNSQSLLMKGLSLIRTGRHNDAVLSLEQSVRHNTSKKAVSKALYELTKLKIESKDYYGAHYTLERCKFVEVEDEMINRLRTFLQATTFIMKGDISKGVVILTEIIKSQKYSNFLKPLLYANRSYGYFCLGRYAQAIKDIKILETIDSKMHSSILYNKELLQGILACNKMEYSAAKSFFCKAADLRPKLSDAPFFQVNQ